MNTWSSASRGSPLQAAAPRRSPSHRIRRLALFSALLCLVPASVSLVGALTSSSNSTLSIRFVEWLRDNGARGVVNWVEATWYSFNAPATGGPGLHSLPRQAGVAAQRNAPGPGTGALPTPLAPAIAPPLPGEGQWHSTFAPAAVSEPPVLITSFRPDPNYPRLVAGVAWINRRRTILTLIPGRQEPAVSLPSRGATEVPPEARRKLVATFNSAFKLADSRGGVVLNGHTYSPLRPGVATLLKRRDGSIDVVGWSGGPVAGPDVVFARQNLPLIVSGGRPNPNLSDGPEWGATLGNAIRVWRSGIGITRDGNLVYAAANYQTVGSLAAILIRAGAVRAMQLDINAYWTSFITYRQPGAVGAMNLLAGMNRSPQRYLSPDDRDFFAVFLR